jgi:hypothetical protein
VRAKLERPVSRQFDGHKRDRQVPTEDLVIGPPPVATGWIEIRRHRPELRPHQVIDSDGTTEARVITERATVMRPDLVWEDLIEQVSSSVE